ncbi:MAG TPA: hypothetical protein VFN22_05535 [Gemmatimonadales bacterium]|nr:hypothetical protein [Gemmatimonadales bacterium]
MALVLIDHVVSHLIDGTFAHGVGVVALCPLETNSMIAARHHSGRPLHALQHLGQNDRWMDPDEQMEVRRDDPDRQDSGAFLVGDHFKVCSQVFRGWQGDERPTVAGCPSEVDVEAVTHP